MEEQNPQMNLRYSLTDNRLKVWSEELPGEYQYSFALLRDGEEQIRLHYGPENSACFWLSNPGAYQVKGFAISDTAPRREDLTESILFEGVPLQTKIRKKRPSAEESAGKLARELWSFREQTVRLAIFDYRAQNKDSKLGKVWDVLHPLIQILIYWFVFGIGFRSGQPVDGYPYLLWMLCGLAPWFFISSGITGGCGCIYSKSAVVLRMRYPLATIPLSRVLEDYFTHLVTMGILLLVTLLYGYGPRLEWLNILYYQLYTIFLLYALALITSTLTMLARDYQKLIVSLIRLLFYLTPILWTIDRLPEKARGVLYLNPVLYIVNGYRDSLLYHRNFWEHPREILFFWLLAIVLLAVGSWTHYGKREQFRDMI